MATASAKKAKSPEEVKETAFEIFTLPEAEQVILRNQVIDENAPGTILRDFQMLLEFIQFNKPEVSNKHHLLPLKTLPDLNAKMSHPITLDLKRPQAKSYPHLQSLYLLVRVTGLAIIQHQHGKPWLMLNEPVLQSWKNLNQVEQYFTLLEAWLLRGDFEILGESGMGWGTTPMQCLQLFKRISPVGLQISGDPREGERIRYSPGLYHLAFLELFGFICIEYGEPLKGEGWRIFALQKTQFGESLLRLIENLQLTDCEDIVDLVRYCEQPEALFGLWQPIFKPFFPMWQHNLTVPKSEFKPGVYVFKVSLGPKTWRRIAISAEQSLDDLADAILDAFDFDLDHLYVFLYHNCLGKKVSAIHSAGMDADFFASDVLIGDIPLAVGTSMVFHYDFGDDWRFDVLLESVDPADHSMKKPKLLEKQGKAPEQYAEMD